MENNPDLQHALRMFRENLDDPLLARDFAIRVLEEGGFQEVIQFLIDYYSQDGEEPDHDLEVHYKNLFDINGRYQL